MIDAGTGEDLPQLGRNRALIADGQRGQHPRIGMLR